MMSEYSLTKIVVLTLVTMNMVVPADSHFSPVQFSLHKHSPVLVLQTLGLTVPSGLHWHSVIKVKIIDFRS